MKNKLVPKMRFSGFMEEWKDELFSDTFLPLNNNTLSRADLNYDNGSTKNIHYGDILIKFGECLDVSKENLPFITDEKEVDKYSHLQNGDVIFADTAEDETAGKCIELLNLSNDRIISGLHTIACRPLSPFANGYLGYFLNSSAYHNQLLTLMQGTKVVGISKSAIKGTYISYPEIEEQTLIYNYFEKLDTLINKTQSKLDKLKNIKNASLEKMFPKKGASTPEIRFKGFTEEWEEKELVEVAPLQRGFDLPTQYIITGNIPIVYSNGILNFHEEAKCKAPGLITGRSGTIGKFTYIEDGEYWPHNTTLWVTDFKSNVPMFIYYLYQTINIIRFSTGSGVPTLNRNDVHVNKCFTPRTDEQTLIGIFFKNLDNLILKNEQQLTKLQNIKKACLEKMFVNKEDTL